MKKCFLLLTILIAFSLLSAGAMPDPVDTVNVLKISKIELAIMIQQPNTKLIEVGNDYIIVTIDGVEHYYLVEEE